MSEARDFWSRRKAGVAAETEAEALAQEARAIDAEQTGKTDAEILADLGLPDPDSLGAGDDFSGFMAKVVPERIRLRALRKLWLTNPVLANVDGLVDYGEDFTDAALVIENMQSTYRVGQGMQAHLDEMARQAEREAAAEETPEDIADATAPPAGELPEDEPATAMTAKAPEEAADAAVQAEATAEVRATFEEELAGRPRRRMRFRFESHEVTNA